MKAYLTDLLTADPKVKFFKKKSADMDTAECLRFTFARERLNEPPMKEVWQEAGSKKRR